ncbi:ribulose bisphosphate carboxylase small subunit [Chroococcidiopsis sp. CCMEE 29]|uniref:ribulose bisphosphate carboxylase small subunit n=1 Tax=Chroococcidiopsis sp. CCMEE 29 TaxID=155894 RepID=UPI00201FCC59|nr:ribulose bisphosphate carboxylase small subunit [Chroococcidiopsis sp. CCMEE 29]
MCLASIRNESNGYSTAQSGAGNGHHPSSHLNPKAIAWIRDVLSQKFHIGIEQADTRRFRANSWSDCGVIKMTQEMEAIATLEQLLQSYPYQYVRLFSINPETRQRGSVLVIQQP